MPNKKEMIPRHMSKVWGPPESLWKAKQFQNWLPNIFKIKTSLPCKCYKGFRPIQLRRQRSPPKQCNSLIFFATFFHVSSRKLQSNCRTHWIQKPILQAIQKRSQLTLLSWPFYTIGSVCFENTTNHHLLVFGGGDVGKTRHSCLYTTCRFTWIKTMIAVSFTSDLTQVSLGAKKC